ncbi:MAG: anti-sigma factor [Aeromicrobium sp.]
MTHPEADELLVLARDGRASDDRVARHVVGCDRCTDQLRTYGRLVSAAEHVGAAGGDGLTAPPSQVWARIQAEVAPVAPVALTPALPRRARSRRSAAVVLAAAVAGVVMGGIGGYVARGGGGGTPVAGPSPTDATSAPVAAGTLDPWDGGTVSGRMAMSRTSSSRSLTITFTSDASGPGYIEAWLLDPLSGEMLGLGIVPVRGGTVTVPLDADLSRFTTVDVSREPFDGDPGHSAESLARGLLRGA